MNIETVKLDFPAGTNIILGQAHFIKTVEDLYEAMINSVPTARFGIAFSEASGARLVRHTGNDEQLERIAADNVDKIAAGHCFLIVMKDCFPINVMRAIKDVPEVCRIFCATANPVEVVFVRYIDARAILGVFDGKSPLGIEDEDGIAWRKDFIRGIGYKQ